MAFPRALEAEPGAGEQKDEEQDSEREELETSYHDLLNWVI